MSLPLKDLRTKVSVETMAVIQGYAVAFGKDDSEIARDVLNEWARKVSHASKVTQAKLLVEGITGSSGEDR